MDTLQVIIFAAVLVTVFSQDASKECDIEKGEEFTTCGKMFPETCENYEEVIFQGQKCYVGCNCPKETVRRKDGYCVKPEDCGFGEITRL